MNSNENTTQYSLQSTDKALLRRKVLALMFILGKNKDLQPITSGFHLRSLGKEKQKQLQSNYRMKELLKLRAESVK